MIQMAAGYAASVYLRQRTYGDPGAVGGLSDTKLAHLARLTT
jgi:hypothetical protein